MATTRRGTLKNARTQEPPANPLTQLELVELLHKRAVNELVVVEIEPGRYQVQPIVAWRIGRSTLMHSPGKPRIFRRLDTLAVLLKTFGIGRTVVRLELLE